MRTYQNIAYGKLPEQLVDLYLPDSQEFDLLVWFHGGGLESGSRELPLITEQLIQNGIGMASVEYRMYPAAHYPDFIFDAAASVQFVQKNIGSYGSLGKFYVGGSSAGAYLTMMLCVNPAYLRNAGVDPMTIDCFASDSAQVTTHFNVLRERGIDSRAERIDEAAPLYYVSEDLKFTRLFMVSYTNDMPCRPEQNMLMYKAIKRLTPNADVRYVQLNGLHTQGTYQKNENGTYDFVDSFLEFIRE